ncbi:MAG TPA: hypothetical protein VK995_04955, partial [Oceanipulchritudo sp.]|nr:hypothetical protein [Oceanipulchritudo sp.]
GIWSVLRNNRTKVSRPDALITAWVMLAGFLLTFRVGSYSLWKIAYALTPGGGAIREVPRINLALLIPAVLLICIVLQEAWQGRRLRAWVTCLLAMVLISLEQIQLVENSSISRAERAQLLARAMPVPKDAEAFYAFGKPQWGFHTIVPHDSAMYLAKAWNLPTLNGYSGWIPTGWPLFETEPNTAFLNLFEWARLKGIRDKVYLYDLDSGAWVRGIDFSTTAENFGPGDDLMALPLEEFDKVAVSGWADGEYWGTRTSEGVSVLQLPAMELPSREHYLRMKLDGTIKPDLSTNTVRIVVNGKEMEELTFSNLNPRQEVVFPVELPSGKPWTVEFQNEGSADGPAPGFVLMSFQLEKE